MPPSETSRTGWNVPYFGTSSGVPKPVAPTATFLPLVGDGSAVAERIWAVLVAVGGVVGGAAVVGFLFFASFVLSFGSEPSRGEVAFALVLGGSVAAWGIVMAVLIYRRAGVRSGLRVASDGVEIVYPTFRRPFVVPRGVVRVVATDEAPTILFTKNRRFPIAGPLPEHVFADALDNMPRMPWEDLDPDARAAGFPVAGMITEAARPAGYRHDEPEAPGWASGGSAGPSFREGHLWSGDGSSLPFLRLGPGDVPNVAVVFEGPRVSPRPPWWHVLAPPNRRAPMFVGGRSVRGLLMRVPDPRAASAAFDGWGVVRQVSAQDVLDVGLLVAKPLRGLRIAVYAGLLVAPLLLSLVLRRF